MLFFKFKPCDNFDLCSFGQLLSLFNSYFNFILLEYILSKILHVNDANKLEIKKKANS